MFTSSSHQYMSTLGLRLFALFLVAALLMTPKLVNGRTGFAVSDEYGAPPAPMSEEEEEVRQKKSISAWCAALAQFPPKGGTDQRPGTNVRPHASPVSEVPHLPPWSANC